MKPVHILSAVLFSLFLSCSSPNKSTGKKDTSKSYHQLFIIANTADIEARVRLEKELAYAAETKGYKAIKSIDVIPPVLNDPQPPSREEVVNRIKATGCDAFCIIYYLKNQDGVSYTPGVNSKGTNSWPWLIAIAEMLIRPKNVSNNYEEDPKYRKDISIPGHFTKGRDFYIITELFDATSAANIYSEKSDPFDDASLTTITAGFMKELVRHLESQKILKK